MIAADAGAPVGRDAGQLALTRPMMLPLGSLSQTP